MNEHPIHVLHKQDNIHSRRNQRLQELLTRLFAVTISALRISGSYLLLDEDLEFTVGEIRVQRLYLIWKSTRHGSGIP